LPCGRAWLDLQRYAVRACENLQYDQVANSIRAALRSLLSDYPDLPSTSLTDDTPAASAETQAWIAESVLPAPIASTPPVAVAVEPRNNGATAPDIEQAALEAARSGQIQQAVEMLAKEITKEISGRARFQRKIQLAGICISGKRENIAYPILVELAEEIDRRKLEEWEEWSSLATPLALLHRCMEKLGSDEASKLKIYRMICRLDPVRALSGLK
jgi:hypothetical protein